MVAPHGGIAITACVDGSVRLWDVPTARTIRFLRGHTGRVVAAAFATDGITAATGCTTGAVRVWDLRTGKAVRFFDALGFIRAMAFSGNGRALIVGSLACAAHVLDVSPKWKTEVWALLSTPKWDGEMGRELSHFF